MDFFDFVPFRNEIAKAYHGFTDNANHTSEHPVFDELKVRRYAQPASEVAALITDKIERWVGWNLKNEKTAVGGMAVIRAEVFSFALLGMKIDVTFGLNEEKDRHGHPITTVNSKAETNIDSKGDLGESRRVIRMMLHAIDFEFRKDILREDEYLLRSLDPKGSAQALQELFNNTKIRNQAGEAKKKKASAIEFKKKPAKQTIPLKPAASSSSNGASVKTPSSVKETDIAAGTAPAASITPQTPSSKPKVTVIKLKKS